MTKRHACGTYRTLSWGNCMTRHVRGTYRVRARRAFSLVELVIVIVIIGIVSGIAVPRISHASRNAQKNALMATLTNVRKAIDVYYAEHEKYPGYDPNTGNPDGLDFVDQLVKYSDRNGKTNATYGSPYIFGPYIRAPFPTNPFNNLSNVTVKKVPTDASPAKGTVGWVAVLSNGAFGISVTDADLVKVDMDAAEVKAKITGKIDG